MKRQPCSLFFKALSQRAELGLITPEGSLEIAQHRQMIASADASLDAIVAERKSCKCPQCKEAR